MARVWLDPAYAHASSPFYSQLTPVPVTSPQRSTANQMLIQILTETTQL